jgi:hypothetical protein
MRPPAQLIDRFAETLTKRLAAGEFVDLRSTESALKARIVALLTENFEQEAAIEAEAREKADALVRQGAPGVRRDELDPRRLEQLMKQRIAKERGFAL